MHTLLATAFVVGSVGGVAVLAVLGLKRARLMSKQYVSELQSRGKANRILETIKTDLLLARMNFAGDSTATQGSHPAVVSNPYFFVLLWLALLSGCDVRDRFLSSEDRINAAQPPRASTERTLTLLREEAKSNSAVAKPVEVQYASRMRVRAVECSDGFQPSIATSREAIQAKLNVSCLARRDEELERWAGLLRAGLLAAKGPLRPIPTELPPAIGMNEAVAKASFADEAGVALLELQTEIAVVGLKDSAVLFREKRARNSVYGALSPNGRLFLSGDATKSSIRSTETGEALVDLPDVQAYAVKWLGSHAVLFASRPGDRVTQTLVADFKNGRELAVPGLIPHYSQVVPVPGVPNQFVVLARTLTKIELPSSPTEQVRVVGEQGLPADHLWSGRDGRSADGALFFDVTGRREGISATDLTTLDVQIRSLKPYTVEDAIPTAVPDSVLISGYAQTVNERSRYMYSLSGNTMARIDDARVLSTHLVYARPVKSMAVISGATVTFIEPLPAALAQPVDHVMAETVAANNARKLELFEKSLALSAPADADTVARKIGEQGPLAGVVPIAGPLVAMARDAVIEAVGVYQGKRGTGRQGTIEVTVRRSRYPMVLVMSAYEPIRWNLTFEPGAQLVGILTSGYGEQTVVGSGSVRVTNIGTEFSYSPNEMHNLERAVFRATAKPISVFQGRYEGTAFSVGGQ